MLTSRLQSGCSRVAVKGIELSITLSLIVLTGPLWAFAVWSLVLGRKPLYRRRCIGIHGIPFDQFQFQPSELVGGKFLGLLPIQSVPTLINVVNGSQRLVGPRPVTCDEAKLLQSEFRHRLAVKPGLISPWMLLQKANIAFEPEWKEDLNYVQQHRLLSDLGVLLRSVPRMLANGAQSFPPRGELLGVPFDNVTMTVAIDQIQLASTQPGMTSVSFVNADCLNKASVNQEYFSGLQNSNRVYCDGVGVRIAGKWLGCPVRENVNGTDMLPRLCKRMEGSGIRLFLLGGMPGVASAVERWICERFPRLTVCGTQHGYFTTDEQESVISQIRQSGADMVLVAFGAPRQELWIQEHLPGTGVRVAIGVGGLFDFFSGRIPRAPAWMRELGIEWVFRLVQEPGRMWKRYLVGNFVFLGRVLVYKLFSQPNLQQSRISDS